MTNVWIKGIPAHFMLYYSILGNNPYFNISEQLVKGAFNVRNNKVTIISYYHSLYFPFIDHKDCVFFRLSYWCTDADTPVGTLSQ